MSVGLNGQEGCFYQQCGDREMVRGWVIGCGSFTSDEIYPKANEPFVQTRIKAMTHQDLNGMRAWDRVKSISITTRINDTILCLRLLGITQTNLYAHRHAISCQPSSNHAKPITSSLSYSPRSCSIQCSEPFALLMLNLLIAVIIHVYLGSVAT